MAGLRSAGIHSGGHCKTSFLHCRCLGQLCTTTTPNLWAVLLEVLRQAAQGVPPQHLGVSLLSLWEGMGDTKQGCRKDTPLHLPVCGSRSTHPVCRRGLSTLWMEDQGPSGKNRVQAWPHRARHHQSCPPLLSTCEVSERTQEEHTKQTPEGAGKRKEERERC